MTKIDLDQLAKEIRMMKPYHLLYKTLERELRRRGHWRDRPRGDSAKGYRISHAPKYEANS